MDKFLYEMFQKTSNKRIQQMHVNNFSDYHNNSETERDMFHKTRNKKTQQINVNNSTDYYYNIETEKEISEITRNATTEQMHINNSLDYNYYQYETEMPQVTNFKPTEQMYIGNYSDYRTDTKSKYSFYKNTIESPIEQTLLNAGMYRRLVTHRRTNKYIYARTTTTKRNRHIFYAKYHYGWRCKYKASKRCKNICVEFFKQLCNNVTKCSGGSYTTKYEKNCEVRCNISFYKPDFNKRLFRWTKKTRRRRSTTPNRSLLLREDEEEYEEQT